MRRMSRVASSSASIRSRSRAASSKRRSRAKRFSFARSFGSASSSVSHSTPCKRPRRELRSLAARERSELGRLRGADHAVAAPTKIEVPVGAHRARIRRRAQLADQAKLLERRLELRAEHPPFDPFERGEGGLDGRPLTIRAKVRAQSRAQVASTADVENLVVCVAEEIDARAAAVRRTRDCACAGRVAGWSPPTRRGRRPCARRALARGRSGASRISAVASASGNARWHGRASVTKRCESAARFAGWRPSSRRASATVSTTVATTRWSGEPHRLVVEECHVEARVVRDEHAVTGEVEEAPQRGCDGWSPPQLFVAEARQRGDRRLEPLLLDSRASRIAR